MCNPGIDDGLLRIGENDIRPLSSKQPYKRDEGPEIAHRVEAGARHRNDAEASAHCSQFFHGCSVPVRRAGNHFVPRTDHLPDQRAPEVRQ